MNFNHKGYTTAVGLHIAYFFEQIPAARVAIARPEPGSHFIFGTAENPPGGLTTVRLCATIFENDNGNDHKLEVPVISIVKPVESSSRELWLRVQYGAATGEYIVEVEKE